ncbi:AMP-binding protein [Pseudomonas mangrovi]|uniref:Long-chain acyl-CoA synthetase n=1 Tax=Pseudomonas mangrovi TaxID=2161748 RepID=A0A2T5PEL9_9PSED|nr:AMP-binding protein [Pseudomonas mangrovi]PTU76184.1 long-chain acyl-CoA synthetase [Pseudomonas mangrovi]
MWPAAETLFTRLAEQANALALIEGERRLTAAEVLSEVQARSQRLAQLGARRVALALDNGIEWALWDLAILHAGLVCVPLPAFFSAAQQQHVLTSAGVDLLIGETAASVLDGRLVGELELLVPGLLRLPVATVTALAPGTCKITYTSGTTGQPKGVCLDAAAQLQVAQSLSLASEGCAIQRHLCVLPLATLLENIAGLYAPLLAGAAVELMPLARVGLLGASGLDLARLLQSLTEAQPNSLILLPQLLLALVAAAEQGAGLPDSLRFVAVGGGRVSAQLLQRADALGLPVFEGYGLSECASVVCLNRPGVRRIGSTGQPLPHARVRLAEDGEVLVAGVHMLGYLGEPPLAGDWLATGDLGHFEDGFLVLHGRKKNQFITAYGRNVNPEWVEAELLQQLPIAQAWLHGEALAQNVAVLVPRQPACSDEQLAEAVAAVNRSLPDYARVHRWLRAAAPFSQDNNLATSNGRLRRDALLAHYRDALDELPPPPICNGEMP